MGVVRLNCELYDEGDASMSTIVFFRQARIDGGIRTGIDANGAGLEYYDGGSDDHDPALIWYVDLRAQGDDLPDSPEEARQWLLDNASLVTATYRLLTERLEVGMDPDVWPLQAENAQAPAGVSLVAVCSCMQRVSARQMSKTVLEIAEHWKDYLDRLPQVQPQ
jgi:hypothetical protein